MGVLILALVAFLADRLTKAAVAGSLPPGASRPVIPGVLHLTHVRNPGAAFGLLPDRPEALAWLAAAACVAIAALAARWPRPLGRRGLALLLGGAAGNLVDRLRHGAVVDFIDLRVWPVFNVADVAIVLGGALIALDLWRERPAEGARG